MGHNNSHPCRQTSTAPPHETQELTGSADNALMPDTSRGPLSIPRQFRSVLAAHRGTTQYWWWLIHDANKHIPVCKDKMRSQKWKSDSAFRVYSSRRSFNVAPDTSAHTPLKDEVRCAGDHLQMWSEWSGLNVHPEPSTCDRITQDAC